MAAVRRAPKSISGGRGNGTEPPSGERFMIRGGSAFSRPTTILPSMGDEKRSALLLGLSLRWSRPSSCCSSCFEPSGWLCWIAPAKLPAADVPGPRYPERWLGWRVALGTCRFAGRSSVAHDPLA